MLTVFLFFIFIFFGYSITTHEAKNNSWEDAYRNILLNVESYLADPGMLRAEPSSSFYLAIHDFNKDNIPELVVGDYISLAVYTYENNITKRIADLCEPETWGGINGLYIKDNTLIIASSGSDGSCYIGFTYDYFNDRGKYIIGIYDEYIPEFSIINASISSSDYFWNQFDFDIDNLIENYTIETIKKDNNTIFLEAKTNGILINQLDFKLIER